MYLVTEGLMITVLSVHLVLLFFLLLALQHASASAFDTILGGPANSQ